MRSSTSLAASRAGLASFRARATAAGRSSARKLGHAQDVSMRAGGVRIASGLGWKGVGPAPRTDVLAPLAAWKWIRGVPVRCRIAVPAPTPSRSYSHALCPPSRLALHNTRLAPACLTSREPRATRKCAVRRRWLDRGRSMAWAVCVHRQQAQQASSAACSRQDSQCVHGLAAGLGHCTALHGAMLVRPARGAAAAACMCATMCHTAAAGLVPSGTGTMATSAAAVQIRR